MPHLTRRGFTLVELLIALTLLGIVTAAFYRALSTNQRVYQKQTQVIDLQQNMRAAAAIIPDELREVDASEGDIIAMSSDSIRFRAHRWMGFICSPPVTGPLLTTPTTMIIRDAPFYGRPIKLGPPDVMYVRYEGDDGTRKDDTWAPAQLIAVAPGTPCPDGTGGQLVTMNLTLTALQNFAEAIATGSPVLGYEPVTYGLYDPSGGADTTRYIGLTTVSGRQPLIGPLLPNGLTLAYYDSTGAVTANPSLVARVDITVRALTNQPVRTVTGATTLARVVDSVRTSVALRNNRRY